MNNIICKRKLNIKIILSIAFLFTMILTAKSVKAADFTSASAVLSNGEWTSDQWLTDTETEHWYKIAVPSDGKLTFKMMAYTYVIYELYNEDLSYKIQGYSMYSDGTETSPDTDAYTLSLSKGTYYVKVYKGGNGKYKLNALFESYNVNDTGAVSYDSPQQIYLNDAVTGAITETDTEDWYRINIPSTGYYHYQVSAYTYVRYQLYNEDLSQEIHSYPQDSDGTETSPDTDTYDVTLTRGTYYFKVFAGHTGKYNFRFSALSQSSCNHEYQDTYIESTYTRKGYTRHKCVKCGYTFNDGYQDKLVLSTPSIYNISAGRKAASVTWSSVYNADGYQLYYKTKGSSRTVKIKGGSVTRRTIKGLKSKKKCSFKIRAYKIQGGKTAYSKWSYSKSVKIR